MVHVYSQAMSPHVSNLRNKYHKLYLGRLEDCRENFQLQIVFVYRSFYITPHKVLVILVIEYYYEKLAHARFQQRERHGNNQYNKYHILYQPIPQNCRETFQLLLIVACRSYCPNILWPRWDSNPEPWD